MTVFGRQSPGPRCSSADDCQLDRSRYRVREPGGGGPGGARARAYLDLVARRYDAAGGSRATYGWLTPATSANAEIYGALPILRTRARDLARNNPHAAKAVTALVNNTIGSGIVARPKTGDQNLDRRIVGLWQSFVKEIDADGDGRITGQETQAFFTKLKKTYDIDGDGTLSSEETKAMIQDQMRRFAPAKR